MESGKKKMTYFHMQPVGTLEVYTYMTQHEIDTKTAPTGGVFWADKDSPQGHGPFNTIWDAMQHYKYMIELIKTPQPRVITVVKVPERPGDVINVDFKQKKRL